MSDKPNNPTSIDFDIKEKEISSLNNLNGLSLNIEMYQKLLSEVSKEYEKGDKLIPFDQFFKQELELFNKGEKYKDIKTQYTNMHTMTKEEKIENAKKELAKDNLDDKMKKYWQDVLKNLGYSQKKEELEGLFTVEQVNYYARTYYLNDGKLLFRDTNREETDEETIVKAKAAKLIYNESYNTYKSDPSKSLTDTIKEKIVQIDNNELINAILYGNGHIENIINFGNDKSNIRNTMIKKNSIYSYLLPPKYEYTLAYLKLKFQKLELGLDSVKLNIKLPLDKNNPNIKVEIDYETYPLKKVEQEIYENTSNLNKQMTFSNALIILTKYVNEARGEFDLEDWINTSNDEKENYLSMKIKSALNHGNYKEQIKLENQLNILKTIEVAKELDHLDNIKTASIKNNDTISLNYAEANIKQYADELLNNNYLNPLSEDELNLMGENLINAYYTVLDEIDIILADYEQIEENEIIENEIIENEQQIPEEEPEPIVVNLEELRFYSYQTMGAINERIYNQEFYINELENGLQTIEKLEEQAKYINHQTVVDELEEIKVELETIKALCSEIYINDENNQLISVLDYPFDIFDFLKNTDDYIVDSVYTSKELRKQIKGSLKALEDLTTYFDFQLKYEVDDEYDEEDALRR